MEVEPSAEVRTPAEGRPANQRPAEHRGRGIAAFALRFDGAAGEHVLACLYCGSGWEETPESSARQPCDVVRSNRGDLLRAIARRLTAEYGVPLWEIGEPVRPASSSAGDATAPDSSPQV